MDMRTFRCMHCQEEFVTSWGEEDAEMEYMLNFPDEFGEGVERGELCTPCYEMFMAWFGSLSEQERDRVRRGEDLV